MNIGDNIKKARNNKKITQKQLGKLIGKSDRTIQKYEKGDITPPIAVLDQIAIALGVPQHELINSIQSGIRYTINGDIDFKCIKKYRETMNLSQEKLSEIIGIKLEDLKGIETGIISNPRIDYAVRLNTLFKPNPPFCYEQPDGFLFAGTGGLIKGFNDFINNGIEQSTTCRMDKKMILIDYVKRLAADKEVTLSFEDVTKLVEFLTPVIDPLLEHKLNEILEKHEKEK